VKPELDVTYSLRFDASVSAEMQAGQNTAAIEHLEAAALAGNLEADCFLGAIVSSPAVIQTHAITGTRFHLTVNQRFPVLLVCDTC
jgi:predicted secreted Zn-dependent protease